MEHNERSDRESKKTKADHRASKLSRRPVPEAASGWSNDIDGDEESDDAAHMLVSQSSLVRQTSRRTADETIGTDIPTISTDEVDNDDAVDVNPQITVAPQFSVHQIASFKEIEKEFFRQRACQYIDSKIDIGILYNNLHLQETLDTEDEKRWHWDKLFVEIRNSLTNTSIDS